MRKIVHVSGYSVAEVPDEPALSRAKEPVTGKFGDWEHVCWGDPKTYQLGRIPMALWIARHFDADTIVWSTGASRRVRDGKVEAQILYETARNRYADLHGHFPHRFPKRLWNSEQAFHAWLARVSSSDETSKNTVESMDVLRRKLKESRRLSEPAIVYLVSSANHVLRVLRDAELMFDIGTTDARFMRRTTLMAIPAETNYGHRLVQDMLVDDLGSYLVPEQ